MTLLDLFAALYDFRAQLVVWTTSYILLYAIATAILYRGRQHPTSRLGRLIRALDQGRAKAIFHPILGFGFYVGLPYLALLLGVTGPRLMGLTPSDWVGGIGTSLVLGLGSYIILFLVWFPYLRSLPQVEAQRILRGRSGNWLGKLLSAIQLQAHWAFLRSAPLLLFGDYYGVFAGWGLALFTGWTNPQVRSTLGREGQEESLHLASLALITAVTFYFTKNLWVSAALHLGLELGLWGFLKRLLLPAQESNQQQISP